MQRQPALSLACPDKPGCSLRLTDHGRIGWLVDHLRRAARDQTTPHKTFVPDCPTQSQRMSATVRHGPDFSLRIKTFRQKKTARQRP
jgi:hypothetical protein